MYTVFVSSGKGEVFMKMATRINKRKQVIVNRILLLTMHLFIAWFLVTFILLIKGGCNG